MQKKLVSKSESFFKPFPFELQKSNKKLLIKSPPIDWEALPDDELNKQISYCYNIIWNLEKEGNISKEHLEPYFYTYLEKNNYSKDDIKNIKKLKDWQISLTLLKIAFLLTNGMKSSESSEFFSKSVKKLIEDGKNIIDTETSQNKPVVPRKTIQEAMAEQLSNIIGELQGLEDEKLDQKHDILKWLQSRNVPKAHIDSLDAYFRPRLDELNAIDSDDQLKEGYSSYSKKQIKTMVEWYESLLDDLDSYKRLKQSTRKTRIKKPKSPLQLIKKLKYKTFDDEIKIQSIKPETLIGKSVLWLYNTKTRKLCVYNASEMEKELTVKGTTVLGWDPKTSVGKTLRKPVEQLKTFMNGGKVAMRNFLGDIRAKESKMNGRINKDMLLLKVY